MASKSSSKPKPNLPDLPQEVASSILQRLGTIDILYSMQMVCPTWYNVCKDPSMWKSIDMRDINGLFDKEDDMPFDPEIMCRRAVDRSCGGVREIKLENYASDELLHYIADRAPQLRSLQLALCHGVTNEGLIEVVKELPNLEEFHIYWAPHPKKVLKTVGRCCPLLKSLTFHNEDLHFDYADGAALAIGETMPGLRHLSLIGNKMTNAGLQAILEGCPLLESLDLRQCYFVNLREAIGKTWYKRIKNLKGPKESTKGSEYDMDVDNLNKQSSYEQYTDYEADEPEPEPPEEEFVTRSYTFGYGSMLDGEYGGGGMFCGEFCHHGCCG